MIKTDRLLFDGVIMRYSVFGSGAKALLILPGVSPGYVTDSASAVEKMYSPYIDEYTVYVFDRRDNPPENYSIGDMADEVYAATELLNIKKADVFGASQGGMVALYLAAFYPEKVNGLALCSSVCRIPDGADKLFVQWRIWAESGNCTALAESFADALYSADTLKKYRDVVISANSNLSSEALERFAALCGAMKTYEGFKYASAVKCPVKIFCSEGDKLFGIADSKENAERLNWHIHIFPDIYAHAVYDEAPDFVYVLMRFFGECC